MERWRAAVLAALAAALPVLASDLHGWLHIVLAAGIGSIAAAVALPSKKSGSTSFKKKHAEIMARELRWDPTVEPRDSLETNPQRS